MSGTTLGSGISSRPVSGVDFGKLFRQLSADVRGEVMHDATARALYATDASNYRVVPDIVVVPADTDDLVATVCLAAQAGAPTVLRGGGTSMAGNALGGVVIDVSRHLNRILDIDESTRTAVVEPGVVLTDLTKAAARFGLTFGPDPSSASRATLGGMIANNSCGAHSLAWGTTADNVRALDVLLADGTRLRLDAAPPAAEVTDWMSDLRSRPGREGELHRALQAIAQRELLTIQRRFGSMRRRISGYALDRLTPQSGYDVAKFLAGTEGTLAVTLGATVQLVQRPAATALLVLGFTSSYLAADAVPAILPHTPLTMESINATLVDRLPAHVRDKAVAAGLPAGQTWLLIEFGGDTGADAGDTAQRVLTELSRDGWAVNGAVVTDPQAQSVLWRCRRDGTGLATRRDDGTEAWAGWEDAAVPPQRLGEYLRELDTLLEHYRLSGSSYGHFGEGCMHMRIDFDLFSAAGVDTYRDFVHDAADLVTRLGGSVSGEHGDGRARSELLTQMYGADVTAIFSKVKTVFDPTHVLNPGVIADALSVTEDLRHAGSERTRTPLTVFSFPRDGGSFAQAQRRCVGVGKCRQSSGGVMCPSFQVTGEERHSTRGRAHLLWEMVRGEVITDGWRSKEVHDALDLCLSCKGCLSDCPVNVDMATYKAEFTHHYYKRRLRPPSHYSMGWLPLWARFANRMPRLVNAITRSKLQGLLKRVGGIAQQRAIPEFAPESFVTWFRRYRRAGAPEHSVAESPRQQVMLWPDTFTNYLSPQVGQAAVRVLEAAGLEVVIPDASVCCGLTWVSTGQLGIARRVLSHSLAVLAPALERGIPVIGLEPSCTAALRHDAGDLMGDDKRAAAAKTLVMTLSEALAKYAPDWRPPAVDASAIVQTHCHQHAVMGFGPDQALIDQTGMQAVVLDSGCCGLAGNFGFEASHYDISQAVGERVLLPAVRAADSDTVVLADGFSCRTQIAQGTSRRAEHLAEVLARNL